MVDIQGVGDRRFEVAARTRPEVGRSALPRRGSATSPAIVRGEAS